MRLVLLTLAVLVLAPPGPTLAAGRPQPTDPRSGAVAGSSLDRRVQALSEQLRCPVCQNLSVWNSQADVAAAMRTRIRTLAQRGESDAQIRRFFVARYGDWILLAPPRRGIALAVWLAPAAVLGLGAAVVLGLVLRWRRRQRRTVRIDEAALAAARLRLRALEQEGPR